MFWSLMKNRGIYYTLGNENVHEAWDNTKASGNKEKSLNVKVGYKTNEWAGNVNSLCKNKSRSDKKAMFKVWWD